ncbi:hypothetical protein Hanom_Chr04g00301051 [Helianthus anomalus]
MILVWIWRSSRRSRAMGGVWRRSFRCGIWRVRRVWRGRLVVGRRRWWWWSKWWLGSWTLLMVSCRIGGLKVEDES